MNSPLQRMCHKAHVLSNAFMTHQDAFLAHTLAAKEWKNSPSQDTAIMLHNTDCARDNARDTITTLAEGLLYATEALLESLPDHEMKAIRRLTASLKEAVNTASTAFDIYSSAAVDETEKHAAFKAAQTEVISRTWPLVERIIALSPCKPTMKGISAAWYFDQVEGLAEQGKPQTPPLPDPLAVNDESTIDTDLDGTPAWQMAETPEERDRIIYENRKTTLGQKAAGRMIAQQRYWAKRRREEDEAKSAYTDDLRDEARGTFY